MIDLRKIVEKYPNSISNRSQLAGLLHDLYPSDKREVNVALTVYDSGIATRLAGLNTLDSMQQNSIIKLLMDEYGLQEQLAADGLAIWAKAYGVSYTAHAISPKAQPIIGNESITHDPNTYAKAGSVVNGSHSEHVLKRAEAKEGRTILAEVDGITITINGDPEWKVDSKGSCSIVLNITMVNTADKSRGISDDDCYVNGWKIICPFSKTLKAGMKMKSSITLYRVNEDADLKTLEDLEYIKIGFHTVDGDSFKSLTKNITATLTY